jgi:hypothetical protein
MDLWFTDYDKDRILYVVDSLIREAKTRQAFGVYVAFLVARLQGRPGVVPTDPMPDAPTHDHRDRQSHRLEHCC